MMDSADGPEAAERARGVTLPIAALPFPVLRIDASGRVTGSNGVLEHDLGVPPDAFHARDLADLVDARSRQTLDRPSEPGADDDYAPVQLSFTGAAEPGERTFYRVRRGESTWLIGQPAPLDVANAKTRFLATMSHELRTPLNAVLGYAGLLRDGVYGTVNPQQAHAVRAIVRRAKDLQLLIDDVLDLSNLDSGKLEFRLDEFHPGDVIAEIAEELGPLAHGRQLRIDIRDDMHQPVRLDREKYKRTIMHLAANAVKFTPPRGELEISVAALPDGRFTTVVRDSGIGMGSDELTHVFTTFEQLNSGPTRRYGGLGLGLPIARRTVELMGGTIDIESAPGQGTTARVIFPLRPEHGPMDALGEEVPSTRVNDPIVLAIDNDPEVISLLRDSLTPAGYRVAGALTGARGLELARILQPLAITLDIMMPGKDGWRVLRELKADAATAHLPVIIVSIVAERGAALSLGVEDYLVKPVDRSALIAILDRLRPRRLARTETGVGRG